MKCIRLCICNAVKKEIIFPFPFFPTNVTNARQLKVLRVKLNATETYVRLDPTETAVKR